MPWVLAGLFRLGFWLSLSAGLFRLGFQLGFSGWVFSWAFPAGHWQRGFRIGTCLARAFRLATKKTVASLDN
jgi:hypothetical protein